MIVDPFDIAMRGSPVHRVVAIGFIGPVLKPVSFHLQSIRTPEEVTIECPVRGERLRTIEKHGAEQEHYHVQMENANRGKRS